MFIFSYKIGYCERMGKYRVLWRIIIPLLFWGSIACVILLLPPVPQEPGNLPPETWSYYGNQAPLANQILKYRNEILFVILICAVVTEFLFLVLEKRKEQKK
jgi:hypothetical protein